MEVNCYLQSAFQVSSDKRFSVSIKKLWSKLQPVSNQCPVPQNAQDNQLLNAVRWEIFWRITRKTHLFFFSHEHYIVQPWDMGRKCSQGFTTPKFTTWSHQGHPRVAFPTLTPHRGWMWLAWGAEIKNIKKWNHPCVSSPCQVCWGWDSGRGINQECESGMMRDERKREIKQLFEPKLHFSRVATQSGVQWNRGTPLSPHQCQKSPLAVRCCHL